MMRTAIGCVVHRQTAPISASQHNSPHRQTNTHTRTIATLKTQSHACLEHGNQIEGPMALTGEPREYRG
eukprot:15448517-Alexandrium_andersonii.AAC.1